MKYFLIALCVLIICSCKRKTEQENEITKVELIRTGAWSDYGAEISVDSALNYKYYGKYRDVKAGFFMGKVSPQFWDTLNRKLERINFKTIPATDAMNAVDINYFELLVNWKNGKRRISRMRDNASNDAILNVLEWLNGSSKNIRLKQVKDAIKFEIVFPNQYPVHFDHIKFPPPIKKRKGIN